MPKPLAEIVIDENLCTAAELARAARIADERQVPLVAVLVRESGLDEVKLLAALHRHIRVGVADPGTTAADPEAVRMIPRDVCNRLRVLPLSLADYEVGSRHLRLAMADPTDAVALAEIEHLTGCSIEPELMTLSAIEEMVEKAYRAFVTEVMSRRPAEREASEWPADSATEKLAHRGARASSAETAGKERSSERGVPRTTMPYHSVAGDADLPTRHAALVRLLIRQGLISEEEFEEEVRLLMKEQDEQT